MKSTTKEIKANSVNGAPIADSSRSVALGRSSLDQEGTVRYQQADPGRGGDQASPVVTAKSSTGKPCS